MPPLETGSVPVTWLVKLTPVKTPPSVKFPLEVTAPLKLIPLTVPVPTTLVTVPSNSSFEVTVKFGYVPVITLVPAPVKPTVWSGAVLVIVNVPFEVIGLPLTDIPAPAVAATFVTVPTLTEPPKLVLPPLIVMAELVSLLLAIDPANIVLVTVPVSVV